jgi:hypothetical protein
MDKKCANCKNARRACNEKYVGCIYWENERENELELKTDEEIMNELNLNSFSTGWVYLGRYPEQAEAPDVTISANVMTNGVICFEKDFSCRKFEERLI